MHARRTPATTRVNIRRIRLAALACAFLLACDAGNTSFPCISDEDCAIGNACQDGVCGTACVTPCAHGTTCRAGACLALDAGAPPVVTSSSAAGFSSSSVIGAGVGTSSSSSGGLPSSSSAASSSSVASVSSSSSVASSSGGSDGGVCVDRDSDGRGAGCANGADCDDGNDATWREVTAYRDQDDDGHTQPDAHLLCTGATLPPGYRAEANGADCDDEVPDVWREVTLFVDVDTDGVTVGQGTLTCVGETPEGYAEAASEADDCDDVDAGIWQLRALYRDADGDLFTVAAPEEVCAGDAPPNGYRAEPSSPPDCRDDRGTVNPGANEACNSIDDDCDGERDESGCGCDIRQGARGNVYGFCRGGADWLDARAVCRSAGYELVTIDDATENAFVSEVAELLEDGQWYIGLTDLNAEGDHYWSDGSPSSFRAWNGDEPNDPDNSGTEDCGTINNFLPASTWNDARCDLDLPYVCEAE